MAMMPSPAADPNAPAPSDSADPMAAAGGDAPDNAPEVLLTVLKDPLGDGYPLVDGDEDDSDEGGASDGGAPTEQPKPYADKGSLLKAILDILNEDENSAGAAGSSEDQFNAGFSGDDSGSAAPAGK